MIWRVRLTAAASRGLRQVEKENPGAARRLVEAIYELQFDPKLDGKLIGRKTGYKLKFPPYRALYVVHDSGLVKVFRIEKRSPRTYRRGNP